MVYLKITCLSWNIKCRENFRFTERFCSMLAAPVFRVNLLYIVPLIILCIDASQIKWLKGSFGATRTQLIFIEFKSQRFFSVLNLTYCLSFLLYLTNPLFWRELILDCSNLKNNYRFVKTVLTLKFLILFSLF